VTKIKQIKRKWIIMGAWETNLIGNDETQDYFINVESVLKIDNFGAMVDSESFDDEVVQKFNNSRELLFSLAVKESFGNLRLVYIGLLKMMNLELNEEEKDIYLDALLYENDRVNNWREPTLRKSYLDALEYAVENDTKYNFSKVK